MKLAFKLFDWVQIKELGIIGRINAIHINDAGVSFKVRYFLNSEVKEVYFLSDELEKSEPQVAKIGFK